MKRFRRSAAPSPELKGYSRDEGAELRGSTPTQVDINSECPQVPLHYSLSLGRKLPKPTAMSSPILGEPPSPRTRQGKSSKGACPPQNISKDMNSVPLGDDSTHIISTLDNKQCQQSPNGEHSKIVLEREVSETPTEPLSPGSLECFLSYLRPQPSQDPQSCTVPVRQQQQRRATSTQAHGNRRRSGRIQKRHPGRSTRKVKKP
ncbi:hypothetical protein BGZ63DRAFT_379561 [Mariannaea sp. PMI_226]|nr:hypothetical protein BGZ63DRAFT_379561 [Mariannaea sp. PMI_226]